MQKIPDAYESPTTSELSSWMSQVTRHPACIVSAEVMTNSWRVEISIAWMQIPVCVSASPRAAFSRQMKLSPSFTLQARRLTTPLPVSLQQINRFHVSSVCSEEGTALSGLCGDLSRTAIGEQPWVADRRSVSETKNTGRPASCPRGARTELENTEGTPGCRASKSVCKVQMTVLSRGHLNTV